MKRVFITSRYRGNVYENVKTAMRLCLLAIERGCAPFAPHLLYTSFLDDADPGEREAGIACGLAFLEACDEVWAYTGDGVSEGMRQEIAHARRLGKPIQEISTL